MNCCIYHALNKCYNQAKSRIEGLIQSAIDEGANVVLDGRGVTVMLSLFVWL